MIYSILILLFLILLFFCFFYRKKKGICYGNDKISSPAYGRIIHIDENFKFNNQTQKYVLISTFLSIFDIHYQYFPISGKIDSITYDYTGQFNLAYNYNKSRDNEKVITKISNENGTYYIYQIAGKFARRIEQFKNVGDLVKSGEYLGLINFGSRVDILIPHKENLKILVKKDDLVEGGKSIIAKFI